MIRSRLDRARSRTRNWARRAVRRGRRVVRKLPAPIRVPLVRLANAGAQPRRPAQSVAMTPTPGPRVDVPEVTVVVTSRNRAERLAIALRSIQEQDLIAFECIVVDDDSTDDAVSVAQSFAAVDPRFRILVHDRTLGPSAARNAGLAGARAPFVCFLDDDDFLLAGSLARPPRSVRRSARRRDRRPFATGSTPSPTSGSKRSHRAAIASSPTDRVARDAASPAPRSSSAARCSARRR